MTDDLPSPRVPSWDGARNLADLGGLPLLDGGHTAYGVLWRSAAPEWMTTQGWSEATASGLARVVDLRNARERGRRPEHPEVTDESLVGVAVVHAPTEDPDDDAFLQECGPWLDHPRSWTPNLRFYPEKIARAVTAVADSDGGVLLHCAGGRDRTGMIGSVLLALAGATTEGLVANYASGFRGAAEHRGHGMAYDATTGGWLHDHPDVAWQPDELERAVAERLPAVREWHARFDVAGYLREAGVSAAAQQRVVQLVRGTGGWSAASRSGR